LSLRERHLSTAEILARDTRVNITIQDSFGRLPLHWACQCGAISIVKICLTKQPNQVNMTTQSGDTPLHWAVQEGSLPCITLLLDHGALPTIRNQRDETPLDLTQRSEIRSLLQGTSLILFLIAPWSAYFS
jgi:ankyrin repeat protein